MSRLDDLVFVHEAAKRVGMDRQRFRARCIAWGICHPWGRVTTKRPMLKVRMSDVEREMLRETYFLPAVAAKQQAAQRKPTPPQGRPLNRLARC